MFHLSFLFTTAGFGGGTAVQRVSVAAIGSGADPVELMLEAGLKPRTQITPEPVSGVSGSLLPQSPQALPRHRRTGR